MRSGDRNLNYNGINSYPLRVHSLIHSKNISYPPTMCQALGKDASCTQVAFILLGETDRWRQLQFNKRNTLMKVSTRCYEDPQRQLTLRWEQERVSGEKPETYMWISGMKEVGRTEYPRQHLPKQGEGRELLWDVTGDGIRELSRGHRGHQHAWSLEQRKVTDDSWAGEGDDQTGSGYSMEAERKGTSLESGRPSWKLA